MYKVNTDIRDGSGYAKKNRVIGDAFTADTRVQLKVPGKRAPCRCYWHCLDRQGQTPYSVFVTCASGQAASHSDASISMPLLHGARNSRASCIYLLHIDNIMGVKKKFWEEFMTPAFLHIFRSRR